MTSWYSKYCENHRKAQHIACEQHREFFEQVRQTLRDKEDMNSHLMSPVQRCMRYSLLVGTVIDKARKDGLEGRALSDWERMRDIMRELPLKTESIMEASRIDNLEPGIRITALGQMRTKGVVRLGVLPGPYNPSSNPPPSQLKFEQRKIFLFDQMMLVTEAKKSGKAKTASDQFSGLQTIYIYRSKVKMNNMRHFSAYKFPEASGESSGQLFCVADTTPGANVVYVFDPVDADTRAQWVAELRQMEQQQQDFLKVLQNPVMASGGAGDQASGGGGAAGGGPGGSGGVDSGRKSVKDKTKTEGKSFNTSSMRLPNKWGGRLSFITRSRKSHRSETAGAGSGTSAAATAAASSASSSRPQSSRERKNSCPDVQDAMGPEGAASCSSGHHLRSSAGKELRKIPSELGSSGSYGTDPDSSHQQQQQQQGIGKKKSGISFNSLQSFFSTRKSKSRSESKLNPA
ncbi:hypothetical protein BOX15_Mlig026374g1 [Macrostomum lignano]|uniref:DH domain-containing protein n=1 Tax=Macrostomum lignano TaxID=282301 RepID=A0A267EP91_9PLAT|nr:hypothetical protein BOX15_Mlig026374g1 [Macrostomum lignano]